MTWPDRINLTVGVLIAFLPFLVNLVLLVRRKSIMRAKLWRFWLTTIGLLLSLIASLPTPLFYFALEFPVLQKSEWVLRGAALSLPVGIGVGTVALILLGFGRGRVRWLSIAMTLVSMAMLYVTWLGVSE